MYGKDVLNYEFNFIRISVIRNQLFYLFNWHCSIFFYTGKTAALKYLLQYLSKNSGKIYRIDIQILKKFFDQNFI